MIKEVYKGIYLVQGEEAYLDGYYYRDETENFADDNPIATFEEALVESIRYAVCLNDNRADEVIKILNNMLIGQKLTEELSKFILKALAADLGWSTRYLKPDSLFTLDFKFDRINITTDYEDIITEVDIG